MNNQISIIIKKLKQRIKTFYFNGKCNSILQVHSIITLILTHCENKILTGLCPNTIILNETEEKIKESYKYMLDCGFENSLANC